MIGTAGQISELVDKLDELDFNTNGCDEVEFLVGLILQGTGFLEYGELREKKKQLADWQVFTARLGVRLVDCGWSVAAAALLLSGLAPVLRVSTTEKRRLGCLCLEDRQVAWFSWEPDCKVFQHNGCRAYANYKAYRDSGIWNDDLVTTAIQLCDDEAWAQNFLGYLSGFTEHTADRRDP